MRILDRFWRPPPTREGRNEQKKALASILNAAAITMVVTGLLGPAINPALEAVLSLTDRIALLAGAFLAHAVVRAILFGLEDR
jgi:hypothetical protein